MALFSVYVHACQHDVHACDRMCDALAQFTQHLCGDRDDIHDGIGPPVMVAWFNDLNIDLFNMFFFGNKLIQHFFADCHMSVHGNIIMLAKFHICHMESLDHETSQIDFFFCQIVHLLLL